MGLAHNFQRAGSKRNMETAAVNVIHATEKILSFANKFSRPVTYIMGAGMLRNNHEFAQGENIHSVWKKQAKATADAQIST